MYKVIYYQYDEKVVEVFNTLEEAQECKQEQLMENDSLNFDIPIEIREV